MVNSAIRSNLLFLPCAIVATLADSKATFLSIDSPRTIA